MNYKLFETIDQYDIGRELLIKTEGNIKETAKIISKNNGDLFRGFTLAEIEYNLSGLKESIGSNILNSLSRRIGGDIDKIDIIDDKYIPSRIMHGK